MNLKSQIIELGNCLKLSFEPLGPKDICWLGDGKNIIKTNNNSNALHEVAHYLVAHPERRNVVNYGLGACPDECNLGIKCTVHYNEMIHEEGLASCLGILYEKKFDMDWVATYHEHSWHEDNGKNWKILSKELFDLGFLTKKYLPRCNRFMSLKVEQKK